ncbi:MAG: ribonuclease HI [Clostridia bacterium]|nr:ribonuclease HI [Clostridia bacterium]MBR5278637.1 ribonuclease HI [Clostridia bacterium]
MKKINLYTDGACKGNPGAGGWAAILEYEGREKELFGGDKSTTNNRMELIAAIEGLKALKEPCSVTLYSDSQYLVNAINKGWLESWQAKGWKKADKSKVLNDDLWKELVALLDTHTVEFIWVRGHDGHAYNERCDALASGYAEKLLEL